MKAFYNLGESVNCYLLYRKIEEIGMAVRA